MTDSEILQQAIRLLDKYLLADSNIHPRTPPRVQIAKIYLRMAASRARREENGGEDPDWIPRSG